MIASYIYNCNADSSTVMSKSNTQRAKKQIGYNPRAGLVQCLLKHIEMIARSLLNQDLTLCII